jgi:hypothetical protein
MGQNSQKLERITEREGKEELHSTGSGDSPIMR